VKKRKELNYQACCLKGSQTGIIKKITHIKKKLWTMKPYHHSFSMATIQLRTPSNTTSRSFLSVQILGATAHLYRPEHR
jgi:hypothetical protein